MALASTIRGAAVFEVEQPVGVVAYRLRMLTSNDLLTEHFCLLNLLLPPSQEDQLQAEAERLWPEEERKAAEQARRAEMARKLADPATQQRIRTFNETLVRAALVEARDLTDPASGWEPIRLVGETESAPERGDFSAADLGPQVIEHLAGVVRAASFGGEVSRARLATFRGVRLGAAAGPDGSAVGRAPAPAPARVG